MSSTRTVTQEAGASATNDTPTDGIPAQGMTLRNRSLPPITPTGARVTPPPATPATSTSTEHSRNTSGDSRTILASDTSSYTPHDESISGRSHVSDTSSSQTTPSSTSPKGAGPKSIKGSFTDRVKTSLRMMKTRKAAKNPLPSAEEVTREDAASVVSQLSSASAGAAGTSYRLSRPASMSSIYSAPDTVVTSQGPQSRSTPTPRDLQQNKGERCIESDPLLHVHIEHPSLTHEMRGDSQFSGRERGEYEDRMPEQGTLGEQYMGPIEFDSPQGDQQREEYTYDRENEYMPQHHFAKRQRIQLEPFRETQVSNQGTTETRSPQMTVSDGRSRVPPPVTTRPNAPRIPETVPSQVLGVPGQQGHNVNAPSQRETIPMHVPPSQDYRSATVVDNRAAGMVSYDYGEIPCPRARDTSRHQAPLVQPHRLVSQQQREINYNRITSMINEHQRTLVRLQEMQRQQLPITPDQQNTLSWQEGDGADRQPAKDQNVSRQKLQSGQRRDGSPSDDPSSGSDGDDRKDKKPKKRQKFTKRKDKKPRKRRDTTSSEDDDSSSDGDDSDPDEPNYDFKPDDGRPRGRDLGKAPRTTFAAKPGEDVLGFVSYLDSMKDFYNPSERDFLMWIRTLLCHNALTWFADLPKSTTRSWRKLRGELKKRFVDNEATYSTALRNLKHEPTKQTIRQFNQEFYRLARLCNLNGSDMLKQYLLCSEDACAVEVKRREPKDVAQAVQWAIEFHLVLRTAHEKQVEEIIRKVNGTNKGRYNYQGNTSNQRNRPYQQYKMSPMTEPQVPSYYECYNCGLIGDHMYHNCPQKRRNDVTSSRENAGKSVTNKPQGYAGSRYSGNGNKMSAMKNKGVYCKYHKNNSHSTQECRALAAMQKQAVEQTAEFAQGQRPQLKDKGLEQ